MGYYVRSALGAGLFVGSVALFNLKLMKLLEVGTCASGDTPYEIARPCPAGTGTEALLLTAAIFAGLIGVAVFAFRGRPPGSEPARSGPPWGPIAWGTFFTATGAVALVHSLTYDAMSPDGELGGAIVGGTFLLMGAPVLLWLGGTGTRRLLGGEQEGSATGPLTIPTHAGSDRGGGWPSSVQAPAGTAGPDGAGTGPSGQAEGEDVVDKLERHHRLHETGALTDTEFQLEKARLLARR